MGTQTSTNKQSSNPYEPLKTDITITGEAQLTSLVQIVKKRSNFTNRHICGVKGYKLGQVSQVDNNVICEQQYNIEILYETFDEYLYNVRKPFKQQEIYYFLFCICDGLRYWHARHIKHGDLSFKTICKSGIKWKLIDTYFLRGGITAYEKILEGQDGFISPEQMEFLRQGYTRQSPPLKQSDDVFALGMIVLQLMVGLPSSQCYKQSYIRFQTNTLKDRLNSLKIKFSREINYILERMLTFKVNDRIRVSQILTFKCIEKYNRGKYSMKNQ